MCPLGGGGKATPPGVGHVAKRDPDLWNPSLGASRSPEKPGLGLKVEVALRLVWGVLPCLLATPGCCEVVSVPTEHLCASCGSSGIFHTLGQ